MSWIDIDTGQIRTTQQIIDKLRQATETICQLDVQGGTKLAKYLTNRAPGLVTYAAELHQQLQALIIEYGQTVVSLTCLIMQLHHEFERLRTTAQQHEHNLHLLGAYQQLRQQLGEQNVAIYQSKNRLGSWAFPARQQMWLFMLNYVNV